MSLKKIEIKLKRLKSKRAIEHLFEKGKVVRSRHMIFRVIKEKDGALFYVGVAVSKRTQRKAVDRNRIKRQLRAIIKEHESLFTFPGKGMLLFKGKKHKSTLSLMKEAKELFDNLN